jgi:hypothetical protein
VANPPTISDIFPKRGNSFRHKNVTNKKYEGVLLQIKNEYILFSTNIDENPNFKPKKQGQNQMYKIKEEKGELGLKPWYN